MSESQPDKVLEIFRELAGERAEKLNGSYYLADIKDRITAALAEGKPFSEVRRLDSIGFHLVDWQREAAFLVALILFPDRFTNEEIRDEVEAFLVHAPNHVIEAARLGGYPAEYIFREGEPESKP